MKKNLNLKIVNQRMINIGVKMQGIAAKQTDDDLANNYAKLGNVLVSYGDAFGPKSLNDVSDKTDLSEEEILNLIDSVVKDTF